jgi:SAM-dependent methyltransferase
MGMESTVNKVVALRRDIVRKARQVGALKMLKHGAEKLVRDLSPSSLQPDPFDVRYGTDTAQIISVGALDIPDERLAHSNRYEAVVPEMFDCIMQDLNIQYRRFSFVDVGSGKGRAMLLASRFPFKEIVGVEISAALTIIAERNIRLFRDDSQQCFAIRPTCVDGGSFELPLVDAVLYFNNPFDEQVMRPLLSRIEQSLSAHSRKFLVAYQRPLHRKLWDRSDAFRLRCERERYVIYESI